MNDNPMKKNNDQFTQHELTAEWVEEKKEHFINLTQSHGVGGKQTVLVHPTQLINVCQKLGVITSNRQDKQAIDRLQRRLGMLQERTEILHCSLSESSTEEYPDLSWEMLYTSAMLDLVNDFCLDEESL